MNLVNFIVWLTSGAIIGWFASRMVMAQLKRKADKQTPTEADSSGKS